MKNEEFAAAVLANLSTMNYERRRGRERNESEVAIMNYEE